MSRIRRDTETPGDGERPEVPVKPPEWRAPDFVPPTPEEQAEIRRLIEETAAKLGDKAREVVERRPLAMAAKRCANCSSGNFVHMGVRFCLACYQRLA